MSNLTPIVSSLLTSVHSAPPIHHYVQSPDRLDSFLQEAYRINTHIRSLTDYLRQIRRPYLSTSGPPPQSRSRSTRQTDKPNNETALYLTDAQREEIDAQTSTLLQNLSGNISSLAAAEDLRTSTETALLEKRFGKRSAQGRILWQWAAGGGDEYDEETDHTLGKSAGQLEAEGRAFGLKVNRESILWYLGWRLQQALEFQRGMVEVRAAREREKEKSILWKTRPAPQMNGGQIPRLGGAAGGPSGDANTDYKTKNQSFKPYLENEKNSLDDEIPPNLRQLFETENSDLLQHYESTLSKVQAAEKSLLEISSLQQTLVGHLSTQGEMIEQLVQDAAGTGENLQRGNRELKRAGERWGKGLARSTFWATVGICGFCIAWDLVF